MPKASKKSYPLRIDPALYGLLERSAAHELRSVNAEIEMLLREGLKRRGLDIPKPQKIRRGRPPVDQLGADDQDQED